MNKLLRYALLAITLCLALVSAPAAFAKPAGHRGAAVHQASQGTHHAYGRSGNRHGHKRHYRGRKHYQPQQHHRAGTTFHLSIHN
ncbi:MAG TPA: hypothetical protein VGL77_10660 [Armatimonadota bacterium]